MDTIEIQGVQLWSEEGTVIANYIKFLPSSYSFANEAMTVNYQLMKGEMKDEKTQYTYIAGGSVLVPSTITGKWENDSQIYDYTIQVLNLNKPL